MGWKRVAWVGCLAPVLGGCHTVFDATHDRPPGWLADHTQAAIEQEIRADAREAWREVRRQYSQRAFTAEFRAGFLDGYTDYLDRGGDARPPAVPPLEYTRRPRYFTPEGHALLRDYFIGFQYGVDVAVATGRRQYLTVPVLIPDRDAAEIEFIPPVVPEVTVVPVPEVGPKPPVGSESPVPAPVPPSVPTVPPLPLPAPRPLPVVPPAASGIPGFHQPAWNDFIPTDPGVGRVNPRPSPLPKADAKASSAEPLPAKVPAGPAGSKFAPGPQLPIAPVVETGPGPVLPGRDSTTRFPEPPAEVPTLPAGQRPPALPGDDVPLIPPNHTLPPPLPANHPESMRTGGAEPESP